MQADCRLIVSILSWVWSCRPCLTGLPRRVGLLCIRLPLWWALRSGGRRRTGATWRCWLWSWRWTRRGSGGGATGGWICVCRSRLACICACRGGVEVFERRWTTLRKETDRRYDTLLMFLAIGAALRGKWWIYAGWGRVLKASKVAWGEWCYQHCFLCRCSGVLYR